MQLGVYLTGFLTCEGKKLPYDGDAEHPPLNEEVCHNTRQRGHHPGSEVRQGGE